MRCAAVWLSTTNWSSWCLLDVFGVGAVFGGLAVETLRLLPIRPVMVGIVIASGLALLPFGFEVPTAVAVACFTIGGAFYGPFAALSVTLMLAKSPPEHLAAMLAARSAALHTASPLGTALGGPLTMALGPRATLAGPGLATADSEPSQPSGCWPAAENR